jgi:anti-sigma factor RsiW
MNRDQLEFALSELHDGTLSAAQEAQIRELLARHPDAEASLHELKSLDSLLRTALPAPAYDEAEFEARVRGALAQAAPPHVPAANWTWSGRLMRIAALFLLAAGVGIATRGLFSRGTPGQTQDSSLIAQRAGPQAEIGDGPLVRPEQSDPVVSVTVSVPGGTPSLVGLAAVTQVSVLPPSDPGLIDRALAWDLFPGRPVVVIDRPVPSVQDAPVPF